MKVILLITNHMVKVDRLWRMALCTLEVSNVAGKTAMGYTFGLIHQVIKASGKIMFLRVMVNTNGQMGENILVHGNKTK